MTSNWRTSLPSFLPSCSLSQALRLSILNWAWDTLKRQPRPRLGVALIKSWSERASSAQSPASSEIILTAQCPLTEVLRWLAREQGDPPTQVGSRKWRCRVDSFRKQDAISSPPPGETIQRALFSPMRSNCSPFSRHLPTTSWPPWGLRFPPKAQRRPRTSFGTDIRRAKRGRPRPYCSQGREHPTHPIPLSPLEMEGRALSPSGSQTGCGAGMGLSGRSWAAVTTEGRRCPSPAGSQEHHPPASRPKLPTPAAPAGLRVPASSGPRASARRVALGLRGRRRGVAGPLGRPGRERTNKVHLCPPPRRLSGGLQPPTEPGGKTRVQRVPGGRGLQVPYPSSG